jgi:hypothetical protein
MPKTTSKPKLTPDELHELFELMSNPMVSFDCGQLCHVAGGGQPVCCDHGNFHPLLFADEYEWLKAHRGANWKRFKPKTRADKKEVDELCDHLLFADCPGIENCNRDHRSLVCRFFPFEPHVDPKGTVIGLAFITEDAKKCPLVAKPLKTFRKTYVKASMKVWQKIIDAYPEEKELYVAESKNRVRRAKRNHRRVRLLKKS